MLEALQSFPGSGPPRRGAEGMWIWKSCAEDADLTVLSAEDAARVTRLLSPEKRGLLAASLTGRRHLLSQLLGCEAGNLRISHNDEGRPSLPDFPDVTISLSDSEGWNALALTRTGPVGIDLECVRPVSWEPMLSMMADADEARAIRAAMGDDAGQDAFFRCWTAKEAILKAAGTGLKGGARRIRLPGEYISGEAEQFALEHDRLSLTVETHRAGPLILSRALAA